VRRHWSWFLLAATLGLLALTLLIPDGWPRTTIIVGMVLGWIVAHRRFASRFAEPS
jgi:hypothetical protein